MLALFIFLGVPSKTLTVKILEPVSKSRIKELCWPVYLTVIFPTPEWFHQISFKHIILIHVNECISDMKLLMHMLLKIKFISV